ncbi:hypothetical protein HPB47_026000 [Ixodes persulcatus]|uniref:Uncharacterized protein n=1 Tax=Ixodes persulcatus TaxID=34615 RepID=A0AC60Q1S0_IXOPE|nr:hypothetical protein HPB47_026000 [Ixodes persulcatus]
MGLGNFQASCQYIARWKKHYDVSMRVGTNESQKLPADYAGAIAVFRKAVSTLRREHDYTDYIVTSMNQTMGSFKRCGISTNLDGTEDGELNDCLALVDDAAETGPGEHQSLVDKALDLTFDSGSDVSFSKFSNED